MSVLSVTRNWNSWSSAFVGACTRGDDEMKPQSELHGEAGEALGQLS
jgi:hypothetical protein